MVNRLVHHAGAVRRGTVRSDNKDTAELEVAV